jgi:hypothetical protein
MICHFKDAMCCEPIGKVSEASDLCNDVQEDKVCFQGRFEIPRRKKSVYLGRFRWRVLNWQYQAFFYHILRGQLMKPEANLWQGDSSRLDSNAWASATGSLSTQAL